MPRFSLHVGTVSRRAGSSAVRHAAYRAGERIWDQRANRTRDYTRKSDVIHSEILAPRDTPDWARDRACLWNRVEIAERRKDSRLAQEVYVAIPREVRPEKRVDAVRRFVQETFVSKGMVADYSIHSPVASDGREDPHVHVMLTTRPIDETGFGKKCRSWDHPARIAEYRIAWERHANSALARSGSILRVDARSLRAQRRDAEKRLQRAIARRDRIAARQHAQTAAILDRIPEIALGRAASNMEKQGRQTERGKKLREIRALNAQTRDERIRQGVRQAMREIRRLERTDRIAQLRTGIEQRAIHALPAALQRRIYLRRNERTLARAASRTSSDLTPTASLQGRDSEIPEDLGIRHERPARPRTPSRELSQRETEAQKRSEVRYRPRNPAEQRLHASIPREFSPEGACRNPGDSGISLLRKSESHSGNNLDSGLTAEGPRPNPFRDGHRRKVQAGVDWDADRTARDTVNRVMQPTDTREERPQSRDEAQQRLQQLLDGTLRSVTPTRKPKREFGLERD